MTSSSSWPQDVLHVILSYATFKDALQTRCVCTEWLHGPPYDWHQLLAMRHHDGWRPDLTAAGPRDALLHVLDGHVLLPVGKLAPDYAFWKACQYDVGVVKLAVRERTHLLSVRDYRENASEYAEAVLHACAANKLDLAQWLVDFLNPPRHELARCRDHRVMRAIETNADAKAWLERTLNPYHIMWTRPLWPVFMASSHSPALEGQDEALMRRLECIPCPIFSPGIDLAHEQHTT